MKQSVSLPEATVHKEVGFVFGQYDIRIAGKVFYMQAVTKTICKQEFPNQHLRLGMLAFDPSPIVAPCWDVVHIGPTQSLY